MITGNVAWIHSLWRFILVRRFRRMSTWMFNKVCHFNLRKVWFELTRIRIKVLQSELFCDLIICESKWIASYIITIYLSVFNCVVVALDTWLRQTSKLTSQIQSRRIYNRSIMRRGGPTEGLHDTLSYVIRTSNICPWASFLIVQIYRFAPLLFRF